MIKLKDILFEQSNDVKEFTYNFEFESGKTNLTPTGQAELNKVIVQVKKLLSQNYKKETMKINVNAQESKVPNQPPYEEEGSLAKARSEMLSKELKRAFPDIEINASYVPKAQGPEWIQPADPEQVQALARDKKYMQYQQVTAKIMLEPAIESGPPERYLVVQPRPGSNGEYYNIVIPSDGYPNAIDYMVSDVAQQFITTHPHRSKIDKNTLKQFLRENGNGRIRVNLVAYPLYTVIVTDYNKSLPKTTNELQRWVWTNKLQQKPSANLF